MNRNKKINSFVKALVDKDITLAFAESMTCGLAAHFLSTCKGTSAMFRGSLVCYHEDIKKCVLRIPGALIEKYSAESRQVTEKMARALKKVMPADVHASVTGLASGGGSETAGKPVGTVFFSILYKGKIHNIRQRFYGTPLQIREKACMRLYELIYKVVIK
jgi:nicotinamide-nucleotide amidase